MDNFRALRDWTAAVTGDWGASLRRRWGGGGFSSEGFGLGNVFRSFDATADDGRLREVDGGLGFQT